LPPATPRKRDRTRRRPRPFLDIATRYAAAIADGTIPASRWVRLAIDRHRRDLDRSATDPDWPYVFDPREVVRVCAFVERLPHVEGRWAIPTIRLEPPQVFVLACLFGWRHRTRGVRRFTSLYWEMGRKGAKSTLMAAIALYHLLEEDEAGPSVVCGATTGSQARIVFTIAQQMVVRSTWLQDRGLRSFANAICLLKDGTHTIGTMRPINSKASTQDGLNPSCIVLDESHAQKFELHDVLKSAQGARGNPLLLCPTTAGYDQLSVGYAMRSTLTKILDGVVTADHVLGLIYTIDEGDDWRDERVWVKANPMVGVTPLLDQMRRYCLDAQTTPGLEQEFRVKCCSEWANAGSAWLSMAAWDACADPSVTLDAFVGRRCWIGADLAQLDDLAAVALLFEDGDRLVGFVRCYLPEDVVLERARAVPEYRLWRDRGELILTAGSMIDFTRIETDIRGWCRRFAVKDICFDQFGSVQITGNLYNSGLPARMEQKNAKTTTGPARELETRVRHRRFVHDGNTCLRWQASNVVVRRGVDDSIIPKKDHPESPNKIDAIDALTLAIGGYLRAVAATPKYDVFVVG
jgi:phage terminase large subunit-like protein